MNIGDYYLDQPLDESKLQLTEVDYRIIPKNFKDEKIYNGNCVSFAGYEWDSIVATVGGRIYKIALTSNLLVPISEVVLQNVINYFAAEFGEPEKEATGFYYTWRPDWGRIDYSQSKEHDAFFSIILTSNKPYQKVSNMYFFKPYLQRFLNLFYRLKMVIPFDKDYEKILLLRSIEWANWPLFISQPVIPVLLIYVDWWELFLGIIVLDWIWSLVRFRYQSITLALLGAFFVRLKWPSSILMGIYFFIMKFYFLSVLSMLWPVLTMFLIFLTPPYDGVRMQQMFREKILNENCK